MATETKTTVLKHDVLEDKIMAEKVEYASSEDLATPIDDSIEDTTIGPFIWLVAFCASIAGSLFGYDTGIISAVLVYLGTSLGHELAANEKELITSLCSGGAFIGAIIAGMTADRYGRKMAIYANCVLFTVGAIIQAASYSIAQMAIGRLIVGFGVGSAAMVVPMYIAEIAPTKFRGRMVGLNNMSITGGQVISYGIGAAFAHVPHGWRYMVGLGGVPSIVLACLLPFCPESPRQLVFHGKLDEAERVVARIYHNASEEQVRDKVRLIARSVEEAREVTEGKSTWYLVKKLHVEPGNFRALAVGLVVAGTNFVMTWINAMAVDPWGRRRVLVSTVWGMSAGLLAVAVAFSFIPVDTSTLELREAEVTPAAIVVLVFIVWFVFFYGVSVGNTAWMSVDFFPMEVRAVGTMFMTCSCWGSNIIVSSTFLTMMKSMTPSGAFGFYAAICGIGWILIIFFYPEVSGLTLEEIQEVFKHGFGVKYTRQLRKERKAAAKSAA
ncbi:putative myo-inositol transporter protein [Lasiodiplodia theobromae]|nr:putative myo-inositol transporter protein [Lasiodiplodia theobromae]